MQVQAKIANIFDCLQRAKDGLAVDSDHEPNWQYVASQLYNVMSYADNARVIALARQQVLDDEADAAAVDTRPSNVDVYMPLPKPAEEIGGES